MKKKRVLFVCVNNSARSQMAEAFLNTLAGSKFEAESAGLEPGELNPLAVRVMKEVGIDISQNKTKSVFDLYRSGQLFSYVVTVCDEKAAQRCPDFPGLLVKTINWSIDDPASFSGSDEEKLEKMRRIRDEIKAKVEAFINGVGPW
ncbi:MAG: arsenate reductase ArsC [Candidatus Aminicenantales bacterium]